MNLPEPKAIKKARRPVSDREQLDAKLRATTEWNFGTICDQIQQLMSAGHLDHVKGQELISFVRKNGNNIISVTQSHLSYYNLSRNHKADEISISRVVKRATEG